MKIKPLETLVYYLINNSFLERDTPGNCGKAICNYAYDIIIEFLGKVNTWWYIRGKFYPEKKLNNWSFF